MSKASGEEEMLVGEYLFKRLREIGVETIFGVPGG
jgi:TPP-dependent 2-oxoacid decarboxylase